MRFGPRERLGYPSRMNAPGQMRVFDRALMRAHRNRAAAEFARHSALFEETAGQLIERIDGIRQSFRAALDLGAHAGILSRRLNERGIRFVVAADVSEEMLKHAPAPRVAADEEFLPFAPGSFDLIVSNLSLQWVNDLPGALMQIKNTLRPGGLFLAALIGGVSLHELRACLLEAELKIMGGASPRFSPSVDLPVASALLQRAGFDLPVVDKETVTLEYADAFALMHDLRGMGASNTHLERLRQPPHRRIFTEAGRLYQARFGVKGRIPATFEILFMHGVKAANPAG
jgi:NADH dehydrogenase [ubiquinone] 1 alpha subcomplex assembly factor 5